MESREPETRDVPLFEAAGAGASETRPQKAGAIRVDGHIVIEGRPCRVASVAACRTGKHGHAKCVFVGTDLFTGKKYETMCPSKDMRDAPIVTKTDYTALDVSDDGAVALMDPAGRVREDLFVPVGTDQAASIARVLGCLQDGTVTVTVLGAMGQEAIVAARSA